MPRPGTKDKKLYFLITGEELTELQRQSWKMAEAFGLDKRIENYQGKRPMDSIVGIWNVFYVLWKILLRMIETILTGIHQDFKHLKGSLNEFKTNIAIILAENIKNS